MKTPDLALPKSGGVVRFRDDDDFTGVQYRRMRKFIVRDDTDDSDFKAYAAALLIESWDIPDLPNLPIPVISGDPEKVDAGSYGVMNWRDVQAIDKAVSPFMLEIVTGKPREGASDPKEPASA